MRLLRKMLFPFSLLYKGVTSVRNKFYDKGVFDSRTYDFPVICVGNLSVGGTGKSPMIESLISLLKEDFRVASLSRGYKRSTSGFILLDGGETVKEVGDEPLQFKRKFPSVMVAVDENRQHGIKKLRSVKPQPEVVLLDDAFQHRAVAAGLNILLTSYGKLYVDDLVLPAGDLRESKIGAQRADIVVVTKCPFDLQEEEKNEIAERLKLKSIQELFFTSISYDTDISGAGGQRDLVTLANQSFLLVTGIANPSPLVKYLKNKGLQLEHRDFPDHHNFTEAEIRELSESEVILTTEKDYMRLKDNISGDRLFYLPIKIEFLGVGEAARFNNLIWEFVSGSGGEAGVTRLS